MRKHVILPVAAAVFLTAGVTARQGDPEAAKLKNPVVSTPESIAAGKKAYEVNCGGCHGNMAQGVILLSSVTAGDYVLAQTQPPAGYQPADDQDVTITGTTTTGCQTSSGPGAGDGPRPEHEKCNQGVGNGSEGCDPGNSNNRHGSNDERGGTPGDPGRKGGGR